MNGFLNLLKPAGMSSSDGVVAVRKLLPRKTAVGHGGTLDPDAAGVLPVCVGKATRLFDYIIDKDKIYIGELCLGIVTDTDDASGSVLTESPVSATRSDVEAVLPNFIGQISQQPPAYCALKRGGVPMYRLARSGENVELEARTVRVSSIEISEQTAENRYLLTIKCGKGVYIRSLMRDIGEKLGCGGHMSFLIRASAGALSAENAYTIDELKAMTDISEVLLPMDYMLGAYPSVRLDAAQRRSIRDGKSVKAGNYEGNFCADSYVRLYAGEEFAGMGLVEENGDIKIKTMLLD